MLYPLILPNWKKKGLIFSRKSGLFFRSHTTRPIPFQVDDKTLRLFFSSRNADDIPFPSYIDVDINDPMRVLYSHETPMMNLGRTGTFDDSGITPVSILTEGVGSPLMYYVGWKRRRYGVTIETSIGVAKISKDYTTLERIFEGPIISQDRFHPILAAAPFVVPSGRGYRMWYCSGSEWTQQVHGPEMVYTVHHAWSSDGLSWENFSVEPTIKRKHRDEVISAPWVIKLACGSFLMWYSYRGIATIKAKNYMVGLATSDDGIVWHRRDSDVGIRRSVTGWDSEMICYPAIINIKDQTYMFYSGNGVGLSGIGYALADRRLEIVKW